jgi:hypothetical protein
MSAPMARCTGVAGAVSLQSRGAKLRDGVYGHDSLETPSMRASCVERSPRSGWDPRHERRGRQKTRARELAYASLSQRSRCRGSCGRAILALNVAPRASLVGLDPQLGDARACPPRRSYRSARTFKICCPHCPQLTRGFSSSAATPLRSTDERWARSQRRVGEPSDAGDRLDGRPTTGVRRAMVCNA